MSIDESSRQMSNTVGNYTKFGGLTDISKLLLTKLKQRDFTDRVLIAFAFLFYLLVVFYVVKKRIWIPGVISWFWNTIWSVIWSIISFIASFATSGEKASSLTQTATASIKVVEKMTLATSTVAALITPNSFKEEL